MIRQQMARRAKRVDIDEGGLAGLVESVKGLTCRWWIGLRQWRDQAQLRLLHTFLCYFAPVYNISLFKSRAPVRVPNHQDKTTQMSRAHGVRFMACVAVR